MFIERHKHNRAKGISLWLGLVWLAWSSGLWAADTRVLVIYPDTRPPYQLIFQKIIEGIETYPDNQIDTFLLDQNTRAIDLAKTLKEKPYDGVIALGKNSLNLVTSIKDKPITIIGAAITDPDNVVLPTMTLVPSPAALFSKLNGLLPDGKRIYTVYSKKSGQWVIDLANQAATDQGIALIAKPAENITEMAQQYRQILESMSSRSDILWISIDGRSLDWPILQDILETAWHKDLTIVSSHLSDAKKGVLFSFFADHYNMGVELNTELHKAIKQKSLTPQLLPVKSLGIAANVRTADHLNLNIDQSERRQFHFVFPNAKR